MGTKNKKIKSFLILLITTFVFFHQFYLSESNKLMEAKINDLEGRLNNTNQENVNFKDEVTYASSDSFVSKNGILSSDVANAAENEDEVKEPVIIKSDLQLKEKTIKIEANDAQSIDNNIDLLNILIFGVNSGLTDTIMVISINRDKNIINLLSIPRDYWDTYYGDKINRIYRKHGFDAFVKSVTKITDLKIDKFVRIDFEGFIKIIDHLGGIWIYNEEDIFDKRYPSADYKYETYELKKGYHNLNGADALKFARTRHGDSDFRRAARQQEVINGVINVIRKFDLKDIDKILNVTKELITYVKTDITIFDGLKIMADYKNFDIKPGNVLRVPEQLYSTRNVKGEYIVLPRDPSLKHIHNYIGSLINNN